MGVGGRLTGLVPGIRGRGRYLIGDRSPAGPSGAMHLDRSSRTCTAPTVRRWLLAQTDRG